MSKRYRSGFAGFWAKGVAFLFALTVVFTVRVLGAPLGSNLVPDDEEYTALMAFFKSTHGERWNRNDNWGNGNSAAAFAQWYGVTVDDGDVIGIDLSDNNLDGVVPDEFIRLSQLRNFSIGTNHVHESLPDFDKLPNLIHIDLSVNELSGDTPGSIGSLTNLRYLNLSQNNLTGPILQQLQGCLGIEEIYVNNNRFGGIVPVFYQGAWPNLWILDASNNALTGVLQVTVPATGGACLPQLQELNLRGNQLSGTVPPGLQACSGLRVLDVSYNQLSGPVPQKLAEMPSLQSFSAAHNQLTAVPDFRDNPYVTNLLVDVSYNAICFGPLEGNATGISQFRLATYVYAGQAMPAGEVKETQSVTEPIVLTCSFSGRQNTYQWFKKNTTGSWQVIAGATTPVFRISHPALADAGRYACKVANTWLTPSANLYLWTTTTHLVLTSAVTYLPPSQPADDLNKNWTMERSYDGVDNTAANVLAESKQFTDALGRATQTQARSRTAPHVFASETIYSTGGQAVLQTLAAPINNQSFAYKEKFVAVTKPAQTGSPPAPASIENYSPSNFEGAKADAPDPLDIHQPGTLGYYYSTANALEPLTPTTDYPFSLTEPSEGPLGGIRRAAAPGDAFRMGAGHEARGGEIPLLNEFDHYTTLRHYFVSSSNNQVSLAQQGTKRIGVDGDGRESVVIANKEGQALMSCLTGAQYPPRALSAFISTDPANAYDANAPRFRDIHVPATGEHQLDFTVAGKVRVISLNGDPGTSLTTGGPYTDSVEVTVQPSPTSQNSVRTSVFLRPGFYRLISLPSAVAGEKTQWFTYQAEYGNFSYTYYDDAGRVVATVAPNGLQGALSSALPGFVTSNTYDTSDRLLATESTDAGRTEYVYARDGRIRFSQSALQRATGRFSYSNYDEAGRVFESGEYQPPTPGPAAAPLVGARLEAEAALTNATVESNVTGASGGKDVGNLTQGGRYVSFSITGVHAGAYVLAMRYSSGGFGEARTMSVHVNGSSTSALFPGTSGWTTFATQTRVVTLNAGSNTLSIAMDEGDSGWINVDYIQLTDLTQGVAFENLLPKSTIYEAENAVHNTSGPVTAANGQPGYLQNFTAADKYVWFNTITVPAAGTYPVRFRYAAALAGNRAMAFYVNGVFQSPVLFPSTGDWNTWDTQTLLVPFTQGANHIELAVDGGGNNAGWINLDYVEVLEEKTPVSNSVLNIAEDRSATGGLDIGRCSQRNQVWYDDTFHATEPALAGRTQEFTRGAVSKTRNDNVTTWYSYDELGQVTWVVQDIPGLGADHIKTLDYQYDQAGNVLEVAYQHGQPDAFHHYYEYDPALRLYKVYTSTDGTVRTQQAKYFYYLHGPLKRVELANRLQGVDYTYTLQGWLKSINHVDQSLDPGGDSPKGNSVPKDLFGMTLDYFSGDYQSRAQATINPIGLSSTSNPFRYDGTIRAASWRTTALNTRHQVVYQYDAKSQLVDSNYGTLGITGSTYQFQSATAYKEGNLAYDPNGNMQSLRRTDQNGQATDNFSYQYTPGTNRLSAVHGGGSPTGATVFSYEYDALGQMTHEHEGAKDRYLKYDVTGKVIGVSRSAASKLALVRYTYDDKGFRSAKIDSDDNGDVTNTTTYVRDVAGNVLSVYESNYANHYTPTRIEVPLYGAGRVGVLTHLDDGTTTGTDEARYEFNDHLGDARVVFHRPTTTAVTRNLELTQTQDNTAFSREDLYRAGYSPAHSGSYVVRLDGRAAPAPMTRTLSLLRGDTVTFSAWGRIPAGFGGGIYTPARTAQLVPLLLLGAAASPPNLAVSDGLQAGGSNATSRLLSGMAAGIGIVFGGHPAPALIGGGTPYSPSQAWVKYRMEYEDGTVDEQQAFVPLSAANSWQLVGVALRAQQAGTLTLSIGTAETSGFTLFDDLQVEQTNGMIVQEQHQYAYGSPLVGLNYAVGNKRYRYGYQGQYAEKDAETGFESFELRLYNSRIGRWTSYDPEGQFSSPYVGMGNNPVSNVDPNGGIGVPVNAFTSRAGSKLIDSFWMLMSNLPDVAIVGRSLSSIGLQYLNYAQNIVTGLGASGAMMAWDSNLRLSYYKPRFNALKEIKGDISEGTFSMVRYHLQKATKMQMSSIGQIIGENPPYGKPLAEQRALAEGIADGTRPFPVNAGVTRASTTGLATAMHIGGRVALVTGIAMSTHHIYNSGNKGLAVSQEVGGWTGSYIGAESGAAVGGGIGLLFGGVGAAPGAIIGGVIGGIGGYFEGYRLGGKYYDLIAR